MCVTTKMSCPVITEDEKYRELLNNIIEIELRMFLEINALEPFLCKEHPETFRAMRSMTHSVLSEKVLESYLSDLKKAEVGGRNLLTEKYARMDNRIPPLNTTFLIDDIVRLESRWMRELTLKYPHSFKAGYRRFKLYLSCELETYSDGTLKLYANDIYKAMKEGRNLAEERYTNLFQQLGYDSLGEMERKRSG